MKKIIIYFYSILFIFFTNGCIKITVEPPEEEEVDFYFKCQVNKILSEANDYGMSALDENYRYISAENGTGGFENGGVIFKIHKDYLQVGSYTLNSNTANKYYGGYFTKSYGEIDSLFLTTYSNVDGILKIDAVKDYDDTDVMKQITGRFAFYAVDVDYTNAVSITYGEFNMLVHAAFLNE